MIENVKIKRISIILLCNLLFSGCGYAGPLPTEESAENAQTESELITLGLTPEFDYSVPESLPGIVIDQVEYDIHGSKVAIFSGDELPDSFEVIDFDTDKTVFTGNVEQTGYDADSKAVLGYGDFSQLNQKGTYYIKAPMLGQSYTFSIVQNSYQGLFETIQKQYYYNRCGVMLSTALAGEASRNACHTKVAQLKGDAAVILDVSGGWHMDESSFRDVAKGCQTINSLLLAYELYPEVFSDTIGIPESNNSIPDILDEVRYEIDWLLKMQDAYSGAVYQSVTNVDSKAGGYNLYVEDVKMDATIQFSATLAKFSYLYQNYDLEYATLCLKAADRAYRYAQQYLEDISDEEYFSASTELYRATGAFSYHAAVRDYLVKNEKIDIDNDFVFWGVVTYLSTKQRVDIDLCEIAIKTLMEDVEEISYSAKNSGFFVNTDQANPDMTKILADMNRLAVVDHIITNHEYATVLQNHLHYLLGRNPQSIVYLDGVGSRNYETIDVKLGIMNQVDQNARLVLMMSAILGESSK